MNNQQLGKLGENAAEEYLLRKGYCILCRNFRCRAGEIDIVASKGEVLHFIEVKTRQSDLFGHPADSVTRKKLGCMKAAARGYLAATKGWAEKRQLQFDVVEIEINHIENI
ncbi:YraN family protein [bacterium 210820-DFI.6.37]|nr:YraN family protein [bacterium 210820-DFI.6.37]